MTTPAPTSTTGPQAAPHPRTVAQRLAGAPAVQKAILAAAEEARRETSGAGASGEKSSMQRAAMTHAWLFTGPPGAGRSNAALMLAQTLVCSGPTPGCGQCRDCRDVRNDTHTDVVHVIPQELSISVSAMRSFIEDAAKLPTVANWRVLVIEDADRLTDEAANALLKTVEEPPASTVIILCAPSTDPQDFSVTLRSRCRHVYVPTPSMAEITRILVEEEGATESDAQLAAAASLRHIGRARRLVRSPELQQRRAQILGLAELVFHGDLAFRGVTTLVKALTKEAKEAYAAQDEAEMEKLRTALGMGAKGKGVQRAMRGASGQIKDLEKRQQKRGTRRLRDSLDLALVDLAGLYRDALMLSTGADVELVHPDFEGAAREIAQRTDSAGVVACLDAVNLCREALGYNVSPQVAMDAMVGRLRLACGVS